MKLEKNKLVKRVYRKPEISSEQANLQALALCGPEGCGAGSPQKGSGGIGLTLTSILFPPRNG
ncbi:MAG: hypothetical protein E3K37_05125 [Candidatus Kuenenia sp.]|nr:hypothetical protein [Candidatus Kuenenia hertensis]